LDEFEQLYIKYEKQIYKYLYYLSRDALTAEELSQETFYRVFNSINSFKGNSKVSTWLFQIAKYTFYSYLKEKDKIQRLTDISTFENPSSQLDTPENIYDKKEEEIYIMNSIKKLKQSYQEIVILRIYNELSFKEIGNIFNQSDTWARVNFYRAKNKLCSIMEANINDK